MIIRNPVDRRSGVVDENTFQAFDEVMNPLGICKVSSIAMQELRPERPLDVRLEFECSEEAAMLLLGAAFSRAMELARLAGVKTRVYAVCRPGENKMMEYLSALGFHSEEKLIRMRRRVEVGPNLVRLPADCLAIEDRVDGSKEEKYFEARQRQIFGDAQPDEWLAEARAKKGFKRLLVVNREGLVGEALVWYEDGCGVMDRLYVAPHMRRQKLGLYLFEAARQYFGRNGVGDMYFDVRTGLTGAVRAATSAGFRQAEILMRYPGQDIG